MKNSIQYQDSTVLDLEQVEAVEEAKPLRRRSLFSALLLLVPAGCSPSYSTWDSEPDDNYRHSNYYGRSTYRRSPRGRRRSGNRW